MKDEMTMFAFMTHTHGLGTDISGHMLHQGQLPEVEFARGDPQEPQTFQQMVDFQVVRNGDILGARCTFDGTGIDKPVSIGNYDLWKYRKIFYFV